MTGAPEPTVRFVVPRYGSGVLGGTEQLIHRLALQLSERGWSTSVWSTGAIHEATWRGRLRDVVDDQGVGVRRFRVAVARHPLLFHHATRLFFRLPAAWRPEGLWIRAQGPYAPSLIRALSREPSGTTVFSPYLYYPTVIGVHAAPHPRLLIPAAHDERPFTLRLVRRAIEASDGLWYNTPEERTLVEERHPVAARKPNAVGTAGVETGTRGEAARFRSAHGIQGPFLLYAGRRAGGKGFGDLVSAYSALRRTRGDVELVVTGDPGQPAPGVRQVGWLNQSSMRDALAAATAVVVPSRMESLSMLALEGWAAGRPALLNGESAVLRAQAHRSGGALLYSGPDQFVAAATRLIDEPALAQLLGESGRKYADANYRWDDVVSRLRRLIEEASAQSSHAAA